mmetsp:Transcript_18939/g.45656  ORF Transcript_18939/g.45656 Transcript_18939/m.45656 type:complete len:85 (+) Transcript_18939:1219-1473(+)
MCVFCTRDAQKTITHTHHSLTHAHGLSALTVLIELIHASCSALISLSPPTHPKLSCPAYSSDSPSVGCSPLTYISYQMGISSFS